MSSATTATAGTAGIIGDSLDHDRRVDRASRARGDVYFENSAHVILARSYYSGEVALFKHLRVDGDQMSGAQVDQLLADHRACPTGADDADGCLAQEPLAM